MQKPLFTIFWLFLFCACSSNNQKFPGTGVSKNEQPDSSVVKEKDERILAIEGKLQILADIPDSLPAYIRVNDMFYDSLKKWNRTDIAGKYLENIIHYHQQIVRDTSLKKILAKAYAWWGIDNYSEAYNDTLVDRLEQFLLLTKGQEVPHSLTPYAWQYLGVQYNVLGDLKKSCYYYNQFSNYAKINGINNWYASGTIDNTIALNELYLFDSSINLINEILTGKGIAGKRRAFLYANLAEAQAGKKLFPESLTSARKSLEILDKLTLDEIDSTELIKKKYLLWWNIGNIQLAAGDLKDAEASLNKTMQFFIASEGSDLKNREFGKLLISQGHLYEAMGKLPEALAVYHKALSCVTPVNSNAITELPDKKDLYTENTIMEALDAKGGVLKNIYNKNKDTGLLIQAVQCYLLAFETETKLTQSFIYDESLMRQTKESKIRSEKVIAACYELYRLTRSSIWTEKAFLFSEKSKAIVLQGSIKRNIAANNTLQNDSNWIHVQHFQQLVNYYETTLATIKPVDTASINKFHRQLGIAESNLLMAKTALVHNNNSYREALLKADDLSTDKVINKLLDNNTSLVEFFSGDSSTYIFSFTKNATPVFFKAENDLSKTLMNFLPFFVDKNKINNEPAAYQAAAHELYREVGLTANNAANITRLLIIPDGGFNFVPFEALITDTKVAQDPRSFAYLLLQKQISYGYSVATLLKQMESNTGPSSNNISCFAPVFPNKERNETPLLYTIDELAAIKKEKPSGKYYLKEAATINRFKTDIGETGIVHIASHANADTAKGLQPMIQFYDSTLYLNEIYTMHINTSLVVLSACETGIGIIDKSEGAMSLARGFYYAGAKNIITSLWSVDDRSTAGIFSDFYGKQSGNNYGLALHEAKLAYLKNATTTNSSPYYWAGFIHIGYDKHPPHSNRLIFIIGILTILLFSLFIYRRKK